MAALQNFWFKLTSYETSKTSNNFKKFGDSIPLHAANKTYFLDLISGSLRNIY